MSDFSKLGLSAEIVAAVTEKGYTTPSPIQAKAIPAVIDGKDVMAAAQTGTGKTAGFTLPILQRLSQGQRASANRCKALILTPTRELAAQVGDNVAMYSKHLALNSAVVFGGVKINPQMKKLRGGVDVLVATPGRLMDLHQQNAGKFDEIEILVLDEADRMLDMGFIRDIRKIIALLPKKRQNLLFSATFSNDIKTLARGLLHQPVEVSVTPPNSTVDSVEQSIYPVDKSRKTALLIKLIKQEGWHQVLVFSRTKHGANRLARQLEKNSITAAAIHGDKSQGARTKALANFKGGSVNVLVATDIAARGIDIDQLPQVVNFDLPNVAEDYVHRIGRTGRAGATGKAVSLVSADEAKQLKDIERLIAKQLERITVEGFEPSEKVPQAPLDTRPPKKKRPKKKKPKEGNSQASNGNGEQARQKNGNRRTASEGNKPSRRRRKPANKPKD